MIGEIIMSGRYKCNYFSFKKYLFISLIKAFYTYNICIYNCCVRSKQMSTSTVNISFQKELLKQIDNTAKEETRTRSELIREAARMYIERKKRLDKIFAFGDNQQNKINLPEDQLDQEIHNFRKLKRN
jgi:CopG family transcriptional regulator / antitoxin EndoAI